MSRTMHFGRDAMEATDADLEDLMAQLSPEELTKLVDEMASDPDDKHLPASVRNSYRCDKAPTGELNRDSLINHINQEGLNAPEKEDLVKFEPGKIRGKVFVPTYNEAELAAIERSKQVAEAVRLDQDEEDALGEATVNDLMTLAEILDTNPQEFIMEAYSDPLKYYPPEPPNTTDVEDAKAKIVANDKNTKDVNLNNIKDIDEKIFVEIFEALRTNDSLVRFEAANCDVTDFAAAVLNTALEQNRTLKSLNLDTNLIGPDTLGGLFEAISENSNTIIEVHVNDQAQSNMGYRVESRIADAICKNNSLVKVGLKFQFTECFDRVQQHLMSNIDRARKDRVKSGIVSEVKWKAPTGI